MDCLEGFLITVRTIKQGTYMEKSKFSPDYQQEIATLTMCPEDLAQLGLEPGGGVLLASAETEVKVFCRPAAGPRGVFFLPLGPVANQLIGRQTYGTGVPEYKGFPVRIRPAREDQGGAL